MKTRRQCQSGSLLTHLSKARKEMELVSLLCFSENKCLTVLKGWLSFARLTSTGGLGYTANRNWVLWWGMVFSPSWLWGEISLILVEMENWGHLHDYHTVFPLYVICFIRNAILVSPAWFQHFVKVLHLESLGMLAPLYSVSKCFKTTSKARKKETNIC